MVDCVKHTGKNIKIIWDFEKLKLSDPKNFERKYFVRMAPETSEEKIQEVFGKVEMVQVEGLEEKAFVTGTMKEKDFNNALEQFNTIINRIRLD